MKTALLQKGFREDPNKHQYYTFYYGEKKTNVFTWFSHGDTEIRGGRINQMGRQLRLTKDEFLELVDCGMTGEQYLKKLIEKGAIRTDTEPAAN